MRVKQPEATITKPKSTDEQRGTEQWPLIVKVAPTQNTDNERAEEAKERERIAESDRQKDKADSDLVKYTGELAFYTQGLFGATVALVIATIGLGVAAFFQARDTKRAVVAAEQSADAAKLPAEAAIGIELPKLFVSEIKIDLAALNMAPESSLQKISITITNYGRTPAFLYWESAEILPGQLPPVPKYPNGNDLQHGTIIEKGQLRTLIARKRDYHAHIDMRPFVAAAREMLWVYGIVWFRDFLNEPHAMRFCADLYVPQGLAASHPAKFIQGGPPAYTESY